MLAQNFEAQAPNQKWVSDIRYVATKEGWLYLAVIMDLFSRKIVGWAMGRTLNDELSRSALRMALEQRKPKSGLRTTLTRVDSMRATPTGSYWLLIRLWLV